MGSLKIISYVLKANSALTLDIYQMQNIEDQHLH